MLDSYTVDLKLSIDKFFSYFYNAFFMNFPVRNKPRLNI